MRLLFDENLSRKLVHRLADLFPGSTHVAFEGLLQSSDRSVWERARTEDLAVVTADADFYELATTFGPPPKVIWLRGCDYPTQTAEGLLRDQAVRIAEFLQAPAIHLRHGATLTAPLHGRLRSIWRARRDVLVNLPGWKPPGTAAVLPNPLSLNRLARVSTPSNRAETLANHHGT